MKIYIQFIFIMLSGACRPDFLDKDQLVEYINDGDNGLTKTEMVEDVEVTVTYKPGDLLILQENGWNQSISTSDYAKLNEKYSYHNYFTLSLSSNNKEVINLAQVGAGNYSTLVETLSFRMKEYANMTTSEQDTVSVADYIYSPTYGMGSSNTLLFVFAKEKIDQDEWIQVNLKEFGLGLESMNFRFSQKDLKETPAIKFTEIKTNNNIK